MPDDSYLDAKYFIDKDVYNCPFCNRRHVTYNIVTLSKFHWTATKECYLVRVSCNSCNHISMHLSFSDITGYDYSHRLKFNTTDIDEHIFYSVPTSFFVLDERIPSNLRALITEAEGCLKMNFLTGASACVRKSIYEMLVLEHAEGANYDEMIKGLKAKISGYRSCIIRYHWPYSVYDK